MQRAVRVVSKAAVIRVVSQFDFKLRHYRDPEKMLAPALFV